MSLPTGKETGSYDAVLKRMLDAVADTAIKTGKGVLHPLAKLNRTASHDFSISLLSGWAVIADIVDFYRDRIMDEGYLKSAVEDRSVYYLGRLLGYRRWQGEAAKTWLALAVSATSLPQESANTGIVQIPAGGNLVVQNIPASGSQPAIFESHDAVEARVEWNKLLPFTAASSQAPIVFHGMTGLRLTGQVTSLRSGSPLLIQTQEQSFFRSVDQVQVGQSAEFTLVTWVEPLKVDDTKSSQNNAELNQIRSVSIFRQQSGFFGRKAPAWKTAPDASRQKTGTRSGGILSRTTDASPWTSMQNNLPPQLVQALAVGPNGQIFAGTSNGLYTTVSAGAEWSAVTTSPGQQNVQSLLINDSGFLYAGGTRGSVSLSTDRGQSWQSLRGPFTSGNGRLDRGHGFWNWIKRFLHIPTSPSPKSSPAPQSQTMLDGVIRTLAECTYKKTHFLFAGTDRGIFFLQAGGLEWTTWNCGLLGYNSTTGLCSTVVFALSPSPEVRSSVIYAGTEAGLYFHELDGQRWKQIKLPGLTTQPSVFAFSEYDRKLFAGTSQGLYYSNDGKNWQKVTGKVLPDKGTFRSLAAYSHKNSAGLLAGTDSGAFLSTDGGVIWKQLYCQEISVFCLTLEFADQLDKCDLSSSLRTIFSVNGIDLPAEYEIKVITEGAVWKIYNPSNDAPLCSSFSLTREASSIKVRQKIPLSNADVRSVACFPTGEFLLTSPIGEFLESEWPGFHLCCPTIALDRIISDLQPGFTVVLHQDQPQPVTILATVEDIEQRPIQAWGRQATVSVLTLKNLDGQLELLRQRDAVLYCKSSLLAASTLEDSVLRPVAGKSISVSGASASLRENTPIAITGLPPTAVLPTVGGVFLCHFSGSADSTTEHLSFTPFGLEQESVQALVTGGGYCWAAVESVGVYLRENTSATKEAKESQWKPIPGVGAPTSAQCLAWCGDSLWAGTDGDHIFQCAAKEDSDAGATNETHWVWTHSTSAPARVKALAADSKGALYAGTPDKGVFRKLAGEKTWTRISSTTPLTNVLTFAIGTDQNLYAGAAQGVFRMNSGGTFEPVVAPLTPQDGDRRLLSCASLYPNENVNHVTALAFAGDTLYAGTAEGRVFSLSPQSASWNALSAHRLKSPVCAITFSQSGDVLAGTRGEGVCRFSKNDGSWEPVVYSASNDITAILTPAADTFLVAASTTTILSDGNAELKGARRKPLFMAPANFTAMLDLQELPRNLASMFQRYLTGFTNPSVSTQKRGQSWIVRSGSLSFLLHLRDAGLPSAQIAVDQIDTFVALSREEKFTQNYSRWKLGNGLQTAWIKLSVHTAEILLGPALPGSQPGGEVAEIDKVTLSDTDESTQIDFKRPLVNLYDPNVTSLNANLAYATQGMTVPLEVLGSGNAAAVYQSFHLRRPPVNFARNQPRGDVTCSLQIHVNSSSSPNAAPPPQVNLSPVAPKPNGEIWKQVPSFFGIAPEANVYTLTVDSEGNDAVQFGDGLQGARLPTGIDNVTARYRSGLGTQGNIDAGSLIVFRKRPLGIRSVSNPVPATDGSNPETAATSRQQMRHWTSALDRIVCLEDYADFCLARPEIRKAQVTQMNRGADGSLIHITLATVDQQSIDPSDTQSKAIHKAIEKACARTYPFALGGFTTLFFRLKAKVNMAASGDQESLRQSIADALREAFSFSSRGFAQSVTATEVIATIQHVRHVLGVSLEFLYLTGELPDNFSRLESQPARWDEKHSTILPAELLLFDPDPDATGIEWVESL